MSGGVRKGEQTYRNRGRTQPRLEDLAAAKDYAALAKHGALGRGTLQLMARNGDHDARETLR